MAVAVANLDDDDDDDFDLIESDSDNDEANKAGDIDKITIDSKEEEIMKSVEMTATVLASILHFIIMLR